MRKLFSMIALLLLSGSLAFAQSKRNYLEIMAGFNTYQVKDYVLNNIRHQGNMFFMGFSFQKNHGSFQHNLEFNFIFNMLKSRYESEKSSYLFNPYLSYTFSKKLLGGNINKPGFFLGGLVGYESHLAYYENWDEGHLYWLSIYQLGIDVSLLYKISEKGNFFLDFQIPVLSFASRPPERFLQSEIEGSFTSITKTLHDNLSFTSLNEHLAFKMDLGYSFHLSEKLTQSFFWKFEFIDNRIPYSKNIKIISHTVGTSIRF